MHAFSAAFHFMLSIMKMLLKREVGGCALNSHGNCIFDHGNSWKNHGIVFLNFSGNLVSNTYDDTIFQVFNNSELSWVDDLPGNNTSRRTVINSHR